MLHKPVVSRQMNPVADTVVEMLHRMPEAFLAWGLFGVVPVLVPACVSVFVDARTSSKLKFTLSSAARLLGWPLLLVALFGLPWFVFELFLVPVLFDAYPVSKTILAVPLAATRWLVQTWYVVLPLVWLVWVTVGTARLQKAWREEQRRAG